jgi:hypothetical protein
MDLALPNGDLTACLFDNMLNGGDPATDINNEFGCSQSRGSLGLLRQRGKEGLQSGKIRLCPSQFRDVRSRSLNIVQA